MKRYDFVQYCGNKKPRAFGVGSGICNLKLVSILCRRQIKEANIKGRIAGAVAICIVAQYVVFGR